MGTGTGTEQTQRDTSAGGYHVNGWYPLWAYYQDYYPRDLPLDVLDYVNVAQFRPTTTGAIQTGQPNIEDEVLRSFQQMDRNGTRVLVLIGGAGINTYPEATATATRRERFVNQTIEYLRKYDLDGVDINWEYPVSSPSLTPQDETNRQNFMALLELFRTRLDEAGSTDGKYYNLVATLGPQPFRARAHDVNRIADLVDFSPVMNYHLTGSWDSTTGHDSPLFSDQDDQTHEYPPSAHVAMQSWINEGMPPEKLCFGAPLFGAVFHGVSAGGTNGLEQSWANWGGNPQYDSLLQDYINNPSYETFWDDTAKVQWTYSESEQTFVSHESPRSIKHKVKYVNDHGLHGIQFWQLAGDTADHSLIQAATGNRTSQSSKQISPSSGQNSTSSDQTTTEPTTETNRLTVDGSQISNPSSYEVTVSGHIEPTTASSTETEITDTVNGTTVSGVVEPGGTDTYQFTGNVTKKSVNSDATISISSPSETPQTNTTTSATDSQTDSMPSAAKQSSSSDSTTEALRTLITGDDTPNTMSDEETKAILTILRALFTR